MARKLRKIISGGQTGGDFAGSDLIPHPQELGEALKQLGRKSAPGSIKETIDRLVGEGKVRPGAARLLGTAVVFAQDRIRGVGEGTMVTAGSKPIDERYFEGTPEELKAARTSQRKSSRSFYTSSLPPEIGKVIAGFLGSKEGKGYLVRALRNRVRGGKLPGTARVKELVKEAEKDLSMSGGVRLTPQPEEAKTKPGQYGLRARAIPDPSPSPAKLRKLALGSVPKVRDIPGRVERDKFAQLRELANDKTKPESLRLRARAMYKVLAEQHNKAVERFGKKGSSGAESAALTKTKSPEYVVRGVGESKSGGRYLSREEGGTGKVVVLGPSQSSYGQKKKSEAEDRELKESIEFNRKQNVVKNERELVARFLKQMGRGRGFSRDQKAKFNRLHKEISEANPEYSKEKVNRIALLKLVPEYANFVRRTGVFKMKETPVAERKPRNLPAVMPVERGRMITSDVGGVSGPEVEPIPGKKKRRTIMDVFSRARRIAKARGGAFLPSEMGPHLPLARTEVAYGPAGAYIREARR